MNDVRRLGLLLAFSNILGALKERPAQLSDNTKVYLKDSIDFFSALVEVLRNLNVATRNRESGTYHFIPNLKELVALKTQSARPLGADELRELVRYFDDLTRRLRELGEAPTTAYQDSGTPQLMEFLRQAIEVYQESPIVLQERILEPLMAG